MNCSESRMMGTIRTTILYLADVFRLLNTSRTCKGWLANPHVYQNIETREDGDGERYDTISSHLEAQWNLSLFRCFGILL